MINKDNSKLKNMKVLVADDTPENLKVLYKTLKSEGYNLSLVKSGEEALNIASTFVPHLILLDIVMPGINGFEVCRQLKSNQKTKNISVVFLSAKMDSEDIIKGFEVGASDYITKPFEQAEVLARVKNHLMLQCLHNENIRYISELERSNNDLEGFAHIVSHDLKEPLRKIISFGERILEGATELSPENEAYLKKVEHAAFRMKFLIEDILKYSGLQKMANDYHAVDLTTIINQILNDLNPRIIENRVTVNVGNLPTLEAVPHQMHQLFQNLISNSLKYHKKSIPPKIDLSSSRDDNGIWNIKISDNGIGFDNKYADHIFKLFKRLHGKNEYEGTGVGLAICNKIIKFHNGTIEVNSTIGEGTTFNVHLPEKQPT